MRYLRILCIVLLVAAMLIMGYMRERYLLLFDTHTVFDFVRKYPRIAATNFNSEIHNLLGFKLSPKLTSSILFSLFFALTVSLVAHLMIKDKYFTKLVAMLYFFYMILCLLFIVLGNLGVDYHLSYGLSHYLEDLFLSPFILMLLIPVVLFSRNKNQN